MNPAAHCGEEAGPVAVAAGAVVCFFSCLKDAGSCSKSLHHGIWA